MDEIQHLEQYLKWLWGISISIGSIWMLIGKKSREVVTAFFKRKEAKLSFDEKYEKFQDARMEKLINTINYYQRINSDLDEVANERAKVNEEHLKNIEALKTQLIEQRDLIRQQRKTIEQDKEALEEARIILRRYRSHIRRLEGLLKENDIEFEKIDF